MDENFIILEIPIEVLHVDLTVEKEDPLKSVLETVRSSKIQDSSSQSLLRLNALSKTSSSESGVKKYQQILIRDLWIGEYWTMSERNLSIDVEISGSVHRLETVVDRIDNTVAKGEVAGIVSPIMGFLAGDSGIPRDEILSHTRLKMINSDPEIVYLRTKIIQRKDRRGSSYWVWRDGPFQRLINNHLEKVPGFETVEVVSDEMLREWPYSPEVEALRKPIRIREAWKIIKSIKKIIEQDDRPRLGYVRQVVGFRQDMWDAAQEVIHSSAKHAVILTSFSNSKYSTDVTEMLSESVSCPEHEILLSFGEPDRGRSPDGIMESKQYIASLAADERFILKGGVSPKSNHAKVVLSDTGMVFICSCNLFSGRLDDGVLESGLLIQDVRCAKSIIEAMIEEEWVPDEIADDVGKIRDSLDDLPADEYVLGINNKLSDIRRRLSVRSETRQALRDLERLLRQIAERPVWSLIRTLDHRPFMADCIERFEKRLVMASDGLRSNGLDKATINRIDERASKSKANVYIWWGRHAPGSKPYDEVDKRGREDAKSRLYDIRKLSRNNKWWLLPYNSFEPMETHAKMFIVDDMRLMVSSDNTLSFGDTEFERGDAGELGIVIDHPRLAMQMRGSMENWLPEDARISGDLTRWWAILGEEIGHQSNRPNDRIPLSSALDSMIERIESIDPVNDDWKRDIEKDSNQDEILKKLMIGSSYGLYYPSQKTWKGVKDISEEDISTTSISLAWQEAWRKNAGET